MNRRRLETLAVHAGDRKPAGDAIPSTTPIVGASSFIYEHIEDLDRAFAGEHDGPIYARYGNPTTSALEEQIAALEGGGVAIATASGMAALYLALRAALVDRRQAVLSASQLYGQSLSLLTRVLEPSGVGVGFVDVCDLDAVGRALAEMRPACMLIEPMSNPLLRITPLDRICELASEHGALTVVDATFTTPVLLRPLELGADLVVHSATKYLAGHGDVLGGLVVAKEELRKVLTPMFRVLGPSCGAFEAYLTMRGVKTLALRMERHCANARAIAAALSEHPQIERVYFPGDPAHPDAATVRRLFPEGLYGGMVSFEIAGAGRTEVFRFLDALELVVQATTLGDVHSLVLYPAMSSHRDLAPRHRGRLGIRDNLVRLSVGIEAWEDIRDDLFQALGRLS